MLSDPEGHVLQLATAVFVRGRTHDPAGSRARRLLADVFAGAERLIGGPAGAQRGTAVQLVSPRLLRRAGVTVVAHDLTAPANPSWHERFDLVRAANVINRDYFDESTLAGMLANLHTYLRPGGLLVLCRTHDDTRTNHATVLRLNETGELMAVARIGNGSEVEALLA